MLPDADAYCLLPPSNSELKNPQYSVRLAAELAWRPAMLPVAMGAPLRTFATPSTNLATRSLVKLTASAAGAPDNGTE